MPARLQLQLWSASVGHTELSLRRTVRRGGHIDRRSERPGDTPAGGEHHGRMAGKGRSVTDLEERGQRVLGSDAGDQLH